VVWDGKDQNGNIIPDGIFYCELAVGNFRSTKMLVKMK
jgi:hypothetical protein